MIKSTHGPSVPSLDRPFRKIFRLLHHGEAEVMVWLINKVPRGLLGGRHLKGRYYFGTTNPSKRGQLKDQVFDLNFTTDSRKFLTLMLKWGDDKKVQPKKIDIELAAAALPSLCQEGWLCILQGFPNR